MNRLLLFASAVLAVAACGGSAAPRADLVAPIPEHRAPDTFRVELVTLRGPIVIEAYRPWAPLGVDRFHYLASIGFFDRQKFFRVVPNFVAQWGYHGDTGVSSVWSSRDLQDDPVVASNLEGTVTFAMSGPNSRSTHLFINLRDNQRLDAMGFAPIGKVVSGMEAVKQLYGGYGDGPPRGGGPDQSVIAKEGNRYLERVFPRLDSIISTRVLPRP